jgi:hypothetical protein
MTVQQDMAIWEMWRQGFHHLAWLAQQCWERGEAFQRDDDARVPLLVRTLVEQCNRQVRQITPESR